VRTATHCVDFDGHQLAYRVNGRGPALVIISQYWQKLHEVQIRLLSDTWQLFHITPVGYGQSDRVPGYAGEALADQVLAVLDRHRVDRFAIWGYSAGGAMAACVARATPRTTGLICGGYSLFDPLTPGTLRQLERRLHPNHASRSLWSWVNSFDWNCEIHAMSAPCLLYWGSSDRQMATKLRQAQLRSLLKDIDFVEFVGLDHAACNTSEALDERVVPMLQEWLSRRLGRDW
jgi:pimeloyl-ACP methyl ester carboxylesterase